MFSFNVSDSQVALHQVNTPMVWFLFIITLFLSIRHTFENRIFFTLFLQKGLWWHARRSYNCSRSGTLAVTVPDLPENYCDDCLGFFSSFEGPGVTSPHVRALRSYDGLAIFRWFFSEPRQSCKVALTFVKHVWVNWLYGLHFLHII